LTDELLVSLVVRKCEGFPVDNLQKTRRTAAMLDVRLTVGIGGSQKKNSSAQLHNQPDQA
jgi:hypothetical protein